MKMIEKIMKEIEMMKMIEKMKKEIEKIRR